MEKSTKDFYKILIRNFNLYFFTGLIYTAAFSTSKITETNFNLLLCLSVGILTALSVLFLSSHFYNYYQKKHTYQLAFTSFFAGIASAALTLFEGSFYVVCTLVIGISAANICVFFKKIITLLRPENLLSQKELYRLGYFFINLLITFSAVNLAVDTIHHRLGLTTAFDFGSGLSAVVNAFYFSVTTLTTVGYGDITAQNIPARILVSAECLTGYLLLGLMVGIITRGIKPRKAK